MQHYIISATIRPWCFFIPNIAYCSLHFLIFLHFLMLVHLISLSKGWNFAYWFFMLYLLFSAFIVNIFLTLILFSVFCYSNLSAKLIFLSFFKLNIYTYIFTHSTTLALTKILTLQYIHYHSVILFSILITISSFM